jgi:ribosomal protein S18 acetylase RimI-like enzyme
VVAELRAVRELSPGELTVVAVAPTESEPLTEVLQQLDDRDYLFVRALERTRRARAGELVLGTIGDAVVAAHFVHRFGDHDLLDTVAPGLYPRLPRHEALTEAVYVAPAWRGRSIAPRMLSATCRRLGAEGAAHAVAYIDVTNRSSLRAFRAAGYDRADQMRVDRFLLGRRHSRFCAADAEARRLWAANVLGAGERPLRAAG